MLKYDEKQYVFAFVTLFLMYSCQCLCSPISKKETKSLEKVRLIRI